jgi:hypothetical protein
MSEVNNNSINYSLSTAKGDNGLILEAHNSPKMKLDRPKITAADFSQKLLTDKTSYSKKEADKRLKILNNDIYQGAKKEKDKHEFNFKRYFTIFGILALLAAALGYFRKK